MTETPRRLVCQDLKRQQDFKSLFSCAVVSKSWANHALPLLYRYEGVAVTQAHDQG